jgi:restriction endonuclease BglII
MKYLVHSHCAGDKAVPATLQKEIAAAILAITEKPARGSATKMRKACLNNLKALGWSSEVAVAQGSDITITSVKDQVGLCIQTGNMARMYADLIKLQTLYLNNSITSAVIVVPSAPVAKLLGSNVAQANRLERELDIFRKAYHVPTLIFALE